MEGRSFGEMKGKFFIVNACLLMGANFAAGVDAESRFSPGEKIKTVTIMAEVPPGKQIYLSPTFGIDILSVVCDGKKIEPSGRRLIDETERYVATIDAPIYLYSLSVADEIAVSRVKDASSDVASDMRLFVLPSRWESLTITYRIRFVDGSFSKTPVTARFTRWTFEDVLKGAKYLEEVHEKLKQQRDSARGK